jgi:hypothetical protein
MSTARQNPSTRAASGGISAWKALQCLCFTVLSCVTTAAFAQAGFTVAHPSQGLAFNAVSGSNSGPRVFTVTSTGNAAVNGLGASISTNADLWSVVNNCPATLPPAATCEIELRLAPPAGTTGVSLNTSFTVTSSNAGQMVAAPISGQVTLATVSASPASLTFTAVTGATTAPQTVTFTAVDGAVSDIAILLAASPFQVTADNCTGTGLGIGQSCAVSVIFAAPAGAGSYGQSLQFQVAANLGASIGRAALSSANLAGTATVGDGTVHYTVTTTAETGPGSWGAAVADIHTNQCTAPKKRISFNIPAATDPGCNPATGVCIVQVGQDQNREFRCPDVEIDGTTQPGWMPNTSTDRTTNGALKIELAGRDALFVFDDRFTVKGIAFGPLRLVHFVRKISGQAFETVGPTVTGNYFGLHADGLTGATGLNGNRIRLNEGDVTNLVNTRIGGPLPADRNLFIAFGVAANGIALQSASGSVIEGNLFNLDRNGNAAGTRLTNAIHLQYARNDGNLIRRNVIAGPLEYGFVCIGQGVGNTLTENQIFDANFTHFNAIPPQQWAINPFDCNRQQVAPSIAITAYGATVEVQGTLNSAPSETFRIEYFHNDTPDEQNYGRGERFISAIEVSTNASGAVAFTTSLPAFARNVSATATRLSTGDTSPFSAAVISPPNINKFTVTPSATGGGTISPSTPLEITNGFTATFTVTPDANHIVLMGGTCGGNLVGTTFTTVPIDHHCTVTAEFRLRQYSVMPTKGANGNMAPDTLTRVDHGATLTFLLLGNPGFDASVTGTCGGTLVPSTTQANAAAFTTNPITADCTVISSFALSNVTHTVTPSAGPGGSISPSSPVSVVHGQSQTFSLIPSSGFRPLEVLGTCGGSTLPDSYITNPISADCTVVASFTPLTWTVTITAGPNGSISPSGPTQVNHGHALALHIQADPGYEASITYVGDSCRGTTYDLGGGRYLYSTIGSTADCSIAVTFAPFPDRVLTVGPGGKGTVTSVPPGLNCSSGGTGTCSASFPHGTVVTMIPTPATNWVVGGYAGCPVPAGTGNCIFTINANTFMNVGFTQVAVNLNVVKAGLGSGVVTSAQAGVIDCGSTCSADVPFGPNFTLNAVASPGSTFRGFSGAGCVGAGNTQCNVQTGDDRTIVATFDREDSTFTVTNTQGSGAGSFMGVLSTIYDAAADFCLPGNKIINFNIPAATDPGCDAVTGICRVQVPADFHLRCADVLVDGYSQPGASPNTATDLTNNAAIKIELAADIIGGPNQGSVTIGRSTTHGFGNIGASNVTIRGIAFPRHTLNIFTGNTGSVIHGGYGGHVVSGSLFGWHADGTRATGVVAKGVRINGAFLHNLRIGGPNPADRNLFTHRDAALCCEVGGHGIYAEGVTTSVFEGNYFNIGRDGLPISTNGYGSGIVVTGGLSGGTPYSTNNIIRHNVLANINGTPVSTGAGIGNTVSENLMFGHPAHLGGISFFTPGSGGSNPQLAPVVTSVTITGTETVVTGTVAADAMGMVRLEFFDNPAAYDGGAGRAQVFSGNLVVTTDASGQATFSKSLPTGAQHIAVTATRLSSGDTSFFSNYVAPTIPPTVILTINKTGGGAGTVSGGGINCGTTCSAPVAVGSTITLTATPLSGSTFSGWSGDCTGTGSCALSMTVNRNVTANFHSDTPVFTVTNTNPGGAGSFMGALATIYDSVNNVCADGVKTVNFNIPAATDPGCNPATGICVLNVPEQFDIRCSDVVVDGYTQPGAAPNTATDETNNAQIKIEFGGTGGTVPRSVSIGRAQKHSFGNLAAVNVVLRGLALPHHRLDIAPSNSGTVLGGGSGHVVSGNMIGFHADRTRATGMLSQGISLFGDYLTSIRIGGSVPADRNMIASADPFSGQGNISAKGVADSIFEGNYINIGHDGVAISPSGSDYGIEISGNSSNGMPFSRNNIVRRNVVAKTGNVPIFTAGGAGNTVSENLLFGHPANVVGIYFYESFTGGNPQARPVVNSVVVSATQTQVSGTVAGPANGAIRLEFFDAGVAYTNDAGRAVDFLGHLDVTLDGNGQAPYVFAQAESISHIAVTATRLSTGDTSKFSNYVAPTIPPTVTLTINKTGGGAGTVSGSGINCGTTCTAPVAVGSTITLTATPEPGILFLGWTSGGQPICPGAPAMCTLTIAAAQSVTAKFSATDTERPVAVMNGPSPINLGTILTLDGSQSTDVGGTIVSYEFSLELKPAGSTLLDPPVIQSSPLLAVTLDVPGTYRFRLRVTDSSGNVSLLGGFGTLVLDNFPPTAVLTAPATGSVGSAINLSAAQSTDGFGGQVVSYMWSATQRPAGSTASASTVNTQVPQFSFTPDVAGDWVIRLFVVDNTSLPSPPVQATIAVSAADTTPPLAQISASPSPALQGSTVMLSAAGSSDPNGGSIVQYRWSVLARPSGSTAFASPATTSAPAFSFTPDRGGTWRLGLVAVDAAGNLSAQATTNLIVRIPDTTAPIAIIDGPDRASAGQTITLSGAASADLAGGIVEYRWSFSASSGASLQTSALVSSSPTLTVTSLTAGVFTIRLIVVDGAGNQSASYSHRLIYGDQSAPVAILTATPLPVVVGNNLVLSGEDSFDVGTGLTAYVFTVASAPVGSMYTAGQLIPRRSTSGPGAAFADFVPDVPGAWRFKLVVRDGVHALSAPAILLVPVLANGKPTAIIDGPEAGKINIPIALDGSASAGNAPGQAIVKYIWTLTRRATNSALPRNVPVVTTSPVFSLTPDKLGRYTVKLEVQDVGGSMSEPTFAEVKISDTDQPVAVFDIKPMPAFVNEDTVLDGSESFDVGGSGLQRVGYSFLEVPPDSIGRVVTPPDPISRIASVENRDGTIDYRDVRATFKPDRPGLWRIQLTARDGVGLTSVPEVIELPVLTRGQPTAVIQGPGSGQINAPIALDGSASNGGGAAIVRYRWRFKLAPFDSNLNDATFHTTGPAFTFTPDKRGQYFVAMRIELANGQNSEETLKRIQISSAGVPVAVLDVTPSPGRAGQPVTLSGKESFSNDGYAVDRYTFSVVERPAGSTAFASPITTANDGITFIPDKAGVWKFQLTVLDSMHTASDPVEVSLAVFSDVPAAPTDLTGTPGDGRATLAFSAPNDGGSPITSFAASCNDGTATVTVVGAQSPIVVAPLVNGHLYSCTVTASNANGAGPASAAITVTPREAFALEGVFSRKTHGSAGTFDIPIATAEPIGGNVTVEPRNQGTSHAIVFRFNQAVIAVGGVSVKDRDGANIGSATLSLSGDEATVTIAGIPDRTRIAVTLNDVNGKLDATAAVGFLVGDINSSRSVNASDIAGVKARSGQITNAGNFRSDLNASGGISATDIVVVKARSGLVLP